MNSTQLASLMIVGSGAVHAIGLALGAFRLGDTPRLAALRETSIVFAALIAIFVLREPVTPARLAGTGVIAAGAAVLLAAP